MTTPSFVQVPPDSTGKKIDNVQVVVGANTVDRQVIVLADPADPAGYVSVLASTPTGTEHGVAVRQVGSVAVTTSAWPLPTGAATETTLAAVGSAVSSAGATAHTDSGALLTSLGTDGATPPSIPGTGVRGWLRATYDRLGGTLLVDGSAHTQPVSAAALPLPTGAATEGTLAAFEAQAHADAGTIATDVVAVTTSLGTDGATPPTIPGTGVRGWLRSIYDRLGGPLNTRSLVHTTDSVLSYMPPAVIDANNSSTAALLSNGVFTGVATDVSMYNHVMVLVNSNRASATNGVAIEFSADGTTWIDSSLFTYTPGTAPNTGNSFASHCRGQYMRVVYTNTNAAQTSFSLTTYLMSDLATGDIVPLGAAPDLSQHAQMVMAQIVGQSTAGGTTLVPVKVNPAGNLGIANASVSVTGAAVPPDATMIGGTDGANLQPVQVDAKGMQVRDDYLTQVPLTDQAGAGAALAFTFATAVDCVWVTDIGATTSNISRVVINGTANSTTGHVLQNGTPFPFMMRGISSVSVYAPSGSTISVCGYRR